MNVMTRRSMLKLSTAATVAGGYVLTGDRFAAALDLPATSFQYGVAAGDPLPGGFVIWTRVTPDPTATPGSGLGAPTAVRWKVATDAALTAVVGTGTVTTDPASDHTVKIDVTGLSPVTQYFYGFELVATGEASRIGAAKTAPASAAEVAALTFALVSCSNYEGGLFTPYRYLATRCLDFVLHVGDYIYEYANGQYGAGASNGRLSDPPVEIVTLEHYRRRHAVHKADADLQDLHAACAWITTIDDHEITNDTWRDGAQNHQPTEGVYADRRNAGLQAYLEWMPIRPASALTAAGVTVYRSFRFGNLASLDLLDLRQYRDQQATVFTGAPGAATDPTKTLLGAAEQAWFFGQLDAAGPRWRLVGNSVQFMQVDYQPGFFLNTGGGSSRNVDAWDGYVFNRVAVQQKIAQRAADCDVVFLTGDIHSSWAADLPLFPGPQVTVPYQSLAVEFVCPSVTSDGFKEVLAGFGFSEAQVRGATAALQAANPHVKYLDGISHGACVLQVTPEAVQADFVLQSSPLADPRWDPNATFAVAASYRTMAGTKQVTAAPAPIIDACLPPNPPPVIPEVPKAVLLPLTAAAVVAGAAFVLHRRNEGSASPAV